LINTLLASGGGEKHKASTSKKPATGRTNADLVDKRLYPAIVKLLDTILQSLTQMRTTSIVDDNPDLASAVDARLAFTNGRRCIYLAQCYAAVKKYGEALALLQHATIHVREAVSSVSLSESDLINSDNASFFPLSADDITEVETTITSDSLQLKRDWLAYNGGSVKADPTTYKKPLFFNIALNYVELDMDRLQQRAGKQPVPAPVAPSSSTKAPQKRTEPVLEKKPTPKAKAEEHVELTPEPQPQARGGLSSLLGGWWNKGY
jgi:signal recognition particle subunit SRP68